MKVQKVVGPEFASGSEFLTDEIIPVFQRSVLKIPSRRNDFLFLVSSAKCEEIFFYNFPKEPSPGSFGK
jgi:hypothetical protein